MIFNKTELIQTQLSTLKMSKNANAAAKAPKTRNEENGGSNLTRKADSFLSESKADSEALANRLK